MERAELQVLFPKSRIKELLVSPLGYGFTGHSFHDCFQARISFLHGERKGQENLKADLIRRIKMLEYSLKQERLDVCFIYQNQTVFFTWFSFVFFTAYHI